MDEEDAGEKIRPNMFAETEQRLSAVLVEICGYPEYRVARAGVGEKIELVCDWAESQEGDKEL